ncbi:hypothetical protein [Rhizobium lentis]|nr:hypothetical protein [Rhizobium lentis]
MDHAAAFEKMARLVFSTRAPAVDAIGRRVYGQFEGKLDER